MFPWICWKQRLEADDYCRCSRLTESSYAHSAHGAEVQVNWRASKRCVSRTEEWWPAIVRTTVSRFSNCFLHARRVLSCVHVSALIINFRICILTLWGRYIRRITVQINSERKYNDAVQWMRPLYNTNSKWLKIVVDNQYALTLWTVHGTHELFLQS